MNFNFTDTLFALSSALDRVEQDLLGVTTNHSKRVAAVCLLMGRQMQLTDPQLLDLIGCALLHDNAVTEYIQTEYASARDKTIPENEKIKVHCYLGEKNLRKLPFQGDVSGAILYHHENADGTGPYGKLWQDIPLYARLIHLADQLEVQFYLGSVDEVKYERITHFLHDARGSTFDAVCVDCFLQVFSCAVLSELQGDALDMFLQRYVPSLHFCYTSEQVLGFASVFATIIDYKSRFTRMHSVEIAKKAMQLGLFYGYSQEHAAKLYLAGALHDIGKLFIDTKVLEKPDKLTNEEYSHIQQHAYETYRLLHQISGLEDVAAWASNHHEKLDGTGYPFGKHAEELSTEDRILACLDIYQALTEERPYRQGMPHTKALQILREFTVKNQLDAHIVDDIDSCFAPTPDAPNT